MNFIISNKPIKEQLLIHFSDKMNNKKIGNLFYYYEAHCTDFENDDLHLIINGYWLDLESETQDIEKQNLVIAEEAISKWPFSKNISGSFAAVILNKHTEEITFCNDVIGIYPLYYKIQGAHFFISSSQQLASLAPSVEIDEAGVAQSVLGYEHSLVASRSLLKDVKRLLPGELIKLNSTDFNYIKHFDNCLYGDMEQNSKITNSQLEEFWKHFSNELEILTKRYANVNLALSGGMDSRLILGGLPKDQKIKCLTYGTEDSYEVNIAKKLTRIKDCEFESFSDLELYFPEKHVLDSYQKTTEAVNILSWLEILENANSTPEKLLLLGDMCEVLPGRNIKTFGGRKQRIKNFLKYFVLNKDYKFTEATAESFDIWKKSKLKKYLRNFKDNKIRDLNINISVEALKKEITNDLNEIFERIAAHNLPYAELYDELYAWYTHSRIPMGKQILICTSKYKSVCPAMSLAILRRSSNIHPNARMNYRFMNKLFSRIKQLKVFKKVPTSQAPLIPRYFPSAMLFIVWGLRSKIDEFLIKRLMKKRDPNKRYRLFKGLNWVKIYQHKNLEDRLDDYFKSNHIGEKYISKIKKTILKRKTLENWPLSNIDIMTLAALNSDLECISKNINESA